MRERGPGRAPRGRVRAEPPPLLFQVYPEPRTEGECLSNIREFLRGCGASLRLEVSGAPREGAAGPAGSVPGGAALPPSCLCADKDGGGRPSLAVLRVGGCGVGGSAALRLGSRPWGAARGAGGGAGLRRAGLHAVPVALLGVRQRGGAGAALPLSCGGLFAARSSALSGAGVGVWK